MLHVVLGMFEGLDGRLIGMGKRLPSAFCEDKGAHRVIAIPGIGPTIAA